MTHAPSDYWDRYFETTDLDWGGRWTEPFMGRLHDAGTRTILELGCGTANDAARLARDGFSVTATDYSSEAIDRAT